MTLLDGSGYTRPLAGQGAADAAQLDRQVTSGLRLTFSYAAHHAAPPGARAWHRSLHDPSGHACSARASWPSRPIIRLRNSWRATDPAVVGLCRALPHRWNLRGPNRVRGKSSAMTLACTSVHPFETDEDPASLDRNFVLMEYGTRERSSAVRRTISGISISPTSTALPILPVVSTDCARTPTAFHVKQDAYVGPGQDLQLSLPPNDMDIETRQDAPRSSGSRRLGQGVGATVYRLRDWGISRQRGWGWSHSHRALRASVARFQSSDRGRTAGAPASLIWTSANLATPLARHPTWKRIDLLLDAAKTGGRATTDTLDTFVDSSWYFARFACPHASEAAIVPCGRRMHMAAGRSIYRRRGARGASPALRALYDPSACR